MNYLPLSRGVLRAKTGKQFLFRASNRFHSQPFLATLTPAAIHEVLSNLPDSESADFFSARFRANSVRQISGLSRSTDFEVGSLEPVESRPEYLNRCECLWTLGTLLVGALNPPSEGEHGGNQYAFHWS